MQALEIVPGKFVGPLWPKKFGSTFETGFPDPKPPGPLCSTFVIAEIGQNHNGDMDLAKKLIVGAKKAGADCVKFQKSHLPSKFAKEALSAPYKSKHSYGRTYGEHKTKLEFSEAQYRELMDFSKAEGIPMTASAMDEVSLDFLVEELKVPFVKIGSGDANNVLLLEKLAKMTKVNAVISTGMSSSGDVDRIVKTFDKHRGDTKNFVILHCTSGYPTPPEEINLNVISALKSKYAEVHIGYSGHELGYTPTLGAVALGARVVERHVTLCKKMKGTDHKCSLDLEEFKAMVNGIRSLEAALGHTDLIWGKRSQDCERMTEAKLLKSLVYARDLPKGHTLAPGDLAIKVVYPHGVPAQDIDQLYGVILDVSVRKDQPVETYDGPICDD